MSRSKGQQKKPTAARPRTSQPAQLDNIDSKRQRFEDAGKFPLQRVVLVVTAIAVFAFLGMAGYQKVQSGKQASSGVQVSDVTTGSSANGSSGDKITQTPIDLTVSGTTASFAVADVQKNKLVMLKYQRTNPFPGEWQSLTGGQLPLISYIAPSGNLVVASSFCEPCRSNSFHIEGNTIVCDTCFTKWDLNTLQGISGACTAFPPDPIKAQSKDGKIVVATADLEAWTPRQ